MTQKQPFMSGFFCNAQRHASSDVLSYKFLCLGEPMRRREFIKHFWKRCFFMANGRACPANSWIADTWQRASAPPSLRPGGP
jgi:hypothetical protein